MSTRIVSGTTLSWFLFIPLFLYLSIIPTAQAEYYFVEGVAVAQCVVKHRHVKKHRVHKKKYHYKKPCKKPWRRKSSVQISVRYYYPVAPVCRSCIPDVPPPSCQSCDRFVSEVPVAVYPKVRYSRPDTVYYAYDPFAYADLATADDDPIYDPQLNIDR